MRAFVVAVSLALVLTGCGDDSPSAPSSSGVPDSLTLTSPVLRDGEPIGPPFACRDSGDAGTSPPLSWSAEPTGTTAFAVTMTDPDAADFLHWGLLDLPATVHSLSKGQRDFGADVVIVRNDFDHGGYGAPCPPEGSTHHYVVTVWALSKTVEDIAQLHDAAVATGSVTVTFGR